MKVTLLALFACLQWGSLCGSNDSTLAVRSFVCCRPDATAPAGIMTDHVHEKGRFSLAYSFMLMRMHGNQLGTRSLSDETIFETYMMSAKSMNMQMHMLMPMYGLTDKLSLMAMVNYVIYDMDMKMMPASVMNMPGMTMTGNSGMSEKMKAYGFSDTRLMALYNLLSECNKRLVLNAGLSMPTGDVDVRGETMQSSYAIFPYGMQLGSGTWDVLTGLAYSYQGARFSLGLAANAVVRTGFNNKGYRFGDEYTFSPWVSCKMKEWISFSVRPSYYQLNKIKGYDKEINLSSNNDASANVKNTGGQRIDLNVGINLYAHTGRFEGTRLLLEYGIPSYQNVNGIQSSLRSVLSARIQYDF